MTQFDLCRYLRWKSQSRSSADPQAILESLQRNQVQLSCLHTCQPFGPDDDLVAPELCNRARTCYVPDPRILDGVNAGANGSETDPSSDETPG